MRDSEQIIKVKKEITSLESELKDISEKLGCVFYDSGSKLPDSILEDEIERLYKVVPEINERILTLKNYNLSIAESEEGIKTCTEKIKELESGMGSIFEKVGVELYCFIGEKELAFPELNTLYRDLKDGELKSEILENKLYSYENNAAKKSVFNVFSAPFKVRGIKKDIRLNNKESLKKFRKIGRAYTEIPKLIDEESNESLLDVLEEYKKLNKSLKNQDDKRIRLQKQIEDNEQKIIHDSDGVKLKNLYSQLDKSIVEAEERIKVKLIELGTMVSKSTELILDNKNVVESIELFKNVESQVFNKRKELIYYEKKTEYSALLKEIEDREGRIAIENEFIAQRVKTLDEHKVELIEVQGESELLSKWLKDNHLEV